MKLPITITDTAGGTLRLTTTKLVELTGEVIPGNKWYLNLRSLLEPETKYSFNDYVKLHRVGGGTTGWAVLIPSVCRIGCRYFTAKDFALIMKAARATKGAKKKKK